MFYVILFFLFVMAVQDYKTGEVSDWLYLPLLFFIKNYWLLIGLLIILLVFYKYFKNYIGGADCKIIIIFICIFSIYYSTVWLLLSFVLALLFSYIKQCRTIRMFPFFFISYLVCEVIL